MAASFTVTRYGQSVKVVRVDWVSASDGSVTATSLPIDGEILRVVTDPDGTDAPTDNYDIALNDEDGFDILGGGLANRDTANTEAVVPSARVVHYGACSLAVTNAGDTKKGAVKIYIR